MNQRLQRCRTHATIRRPLQFCHFSGGAKELHFSSFGASDRLDLTISDLGRNYRCATNVYFQAPYRAIGRIGARAESHAVSPTPLVQIRWTTRTRIHSKAPPIAYEVAVRAGRSTGLGGSLEPRQSGYERAPAHVATLDSGAAREERDEGYKLLDID